MRLFSVSSKQNPHTRKKEEMKNLRVRRRKEILKIRAEINAKQKRP